MRVRSMMAMRGECRVGVDIGGTFTDVALEHAGKLSTSKLLTAHSDPAATIMEGIGRAAEAAGVPLSSITRLIHGTTLVTNALIQRRGARTAFITTDGFRDVIEMRSENRFEQYDLNLMLPEPLVPREDRIPVAERIAADGSVLLALEDEEIERLVQIIAKRGFDSVAIGFMHSYVNGAHEERVGEALKKAFPQLPVSLSSVVSPQIRELTRFNTVIANAYVQPRVSAYVQNLVVRCREAGIKAPLFMFHSGGGLIDAATAAAQPVRLLESGPAGGAAYASGYARSHRMISALSLDMGGTTAKICLIENGEPKAASTFEVARTYRFKKGSGMTVSTPVVEMIEIGAGGGSIASVDSLGRVCVGPQSAGSEPGPACYGRGGSDPTVTDANLLLGRIDPSLFAGGAIELAPELSSRAMETVFGPVSSLSDSAFSVSEVVDENMANAARVHAVENGRDLEQFTMIAFGGGAPLHACRLCEKLGIDRIVVPPGAGVGSAIGFLRAPFSYEAARSLFQTLDSMALDEVNAVIVAMENEAQSFVRAAAEGSRLRSRLTAFMRYSGQGWEIPVLLPLTRVDEASAAILLAEFEREYSDLFGRLVDGPRVEITNWSLAVYTDTPEMPRFESPGVETVAAEEGIKAMFDAALRREVQACLISRARLKPGVFVDGPAMITEEETSTVVTSAFRAVGQTDGSILITRKAAEQ